METSGLKFNISHLEGGPESEESYGPIMPSEALLLYAIFRICQFRRVIEFGGLLGYSARNFLSSMGPEGKVWSVDMNDMPSLNDPRHVHVHKEAGDVTPADFDRERVDLVFFDVHHQEQQLNALGSLMAAGMVTPETVVALHDTGLHPEQYFGWAVPLGDKWVHQQVERRMVNILKDHGWEGLDFSCNSPKPPLKFRHGITLMRMQSRFEDVPKEWEQTVCMPGVLIDGPLSLGLDSQGRAPAEAKAQ